MTSYHGNWGGPGVIRNWSGTVVPHHARFPQQWWGVDSDLGVFGFEGITDGSSNTALFSEKLIGLAPGETTTPNGADGKRGVWTIGDKTSVADSNSEAAADSTLAECRSVSGPSRGSPHWSYLSGAHYSLSYPWHMMNNAYTHFNTPNGNTCVPSADGGCAEWGGRTGLVTATSSHSGGVNVGMADGSVKFAKDSINPRAWWAAGTRKSKDIVSSDAF